MSVSVLNTDADLNGRTLVTAEGNYTLSGLHSYNRGTSAPFAVVAGAAMVANLDADKLDGQEGSYYTNASNLASGTVPTARLGSGTANAGTFLTGGQTYALAHGLDIVNGRLTLTSGTPVTTSDVTAAGTLYFALYKGNRIALYTGTVWVVLAISELSIAVPAAANQVYDVFVDYNSGTPVLALVAWTNDTTRATALTTQDGVLVKTGATGQRYVGTVRTRTASQLNDALLYRHVWNYYNRHRRLMRALESTNSWVYDSGSYQQMNNNAANQVDMVIGVADEMIDVEVYGHASHNTGASAGVSVGEDVTNASASGALVKYPSMAAGIVTPLGASLKKYPAIGRHFYAAIESGGGATTTFYGDNNLPNNMQSGIHAWLNG